MLADWWPTGACRLLESRLVPVGPCTADRYLSALRKPTGPCLGRQAPRMLLGRYRSRADWVLSALGRPTGPVGADKPRLRGPRAPHQMPRRLSAFQQPITSLSAFGGPTRTYFCNFLNLAFIFVINYLKNPYIF